MNDNLYLIHREDYVSHINDKVSMYLALKQLTDLIWYLPLTEENEKLREATELIDLTADNCFMSWGISPSYVAFRSDRDLAELMLHELISPEAAGYYACDCECCYDNDDEDEDEDAPEEDEAFADLMAELSSIVQNIFGDNVSVHIVVE